MDELLEKLKGFKFSGGPVPILIGIVVIFLTTSIVYTIGIDEVVIFTQKVEGVKKGNTDIDLQ